MELFESKRCRRLLMQLDSGLELIDWLQRFTSLPSPRWAEVRVYGTARGVELRSLLARSTAQRLSGAIELIEVRGLVGPKAPPLRGQLVVEGKQLLSGEILRLDCAATLVTIDLYEDMEPFADAVPDANGSPPTSKTWDDAMNASVAPAVELPEDAPIKVGDILNHPKFGLCIVERVEGEQFITVRTSQHRMLRLSLEVLDLVPVGNEGKARIWKVELGTKV